MLPGQLGGHAQTDDVGHVLGTGTAAAFLVPAAQEGTEAHALAHIEHADALGRVQFVAGQGEHGDGLLAKVDGFLAHGLHGVGMEEHALFGGHLCHAADGEDVAHFVVGVHDGDQRRVVGQGGGVFVQIQTALVVHAEQGHAVALAFPVLGHVEDGGMLHAGGDEVALFGLGLQGGPDGGVVAFGTTGREDDLVGMGAQQGGHAFAGFFHGAAHLAAEGVHAGRVAVQIREVGQHGFPDFGSHGSGRVVIEIDGLHG